MLGKYLGYFDRRVNRQRRRLIRIGHWCIFDRHRHIGDRLRNYGGLGISGRNGLADDRLRSRGYRRLRVSRRGRFTYDRLRIRGRTQGGNNGRLGISTADGGIVWVAVKVATSLAGLLRDPLVGWR